MDDDEIDQLARRGDMTKEAVAFRLRAARGSLESPISQKDMAGLVGAGPQTYGNWETGFAYPSLAAMRHFFRRHRIDFNYFLHGDVAQLPHDVQTRLIASLRKEQTRQDRKSS